MYCVEVQCNTVHCNVVWYSFNAVWCSTVSMHCGVVQFQCSAVSQLQCSTVQVRAVKYYILITVYCNVVIYCSDLNYRVVKRSDITFHNYSVVQPNVPQCGRVLCVAVLKSGFPGSNVKLNSQQYCKVEFLAVM